ncbi:hypothetical protein ACQCN2_14655 [Brevibacillus ginsengisoli]|uniref:hypothetical protein n=1 Tax=Brevibacillus ginsengisoli TaxID=363854 RepID=UPI003CF4D5AC
MSSYNVKESREIEAEPEFIYNLLRNYVDGHPKILPVQYFDSLEIEQGGYGEGTVVKVQTKAMGLKQQMRLTVSEPVPGEVLQEEDVDLGLVTHFHIVPLTSQKSKVTIQTTWIQKNGLMGIIEKWFIRFIAKKMYQEELELINTYCLENKKQT